jgi:hypothetical protein
MVEVIEFCEVCWIVILMFKKRVTELTEFILPIFSCRL